MKYIGLVIALAKIIEPLYADYQAAVKEGQSTDTLTVKTEKVLQDIESAIETALSAI